MTLDQDSSRTVTARRAGPAPTVTVVMAVHDGEYTVSAAVGSVLGQTLEDWEFVIVNDASTDGTGRVLQDIADQDGHERITVLSNQQQRGLAYSLNRALDMAGGKYIARMDADDVALPERLERQVAFLDAHPEVDVLGTAARYRVASGADDVMRMPEWHEEIVRLLPRLNPLIHPTVMARVEFFRRNRYDEFIQRGQDYELWARTAERARFHNLPDVLLEYSKPTPRYFSNHWYKFLLRVRIGYRYGRLPAFAFWAGYYLIRTVFRGDVRLT